MDVRSVRGDAATDSLFQPLLIGRTQLRNRLAVAPMTRVSAKADGRATERMVDYYTAFAYRRDRGHVEGEDRSGGGKEGG